MVLTHMEQVFYYETEVEWKGEKQGHLRGTNLPVIEVEPPPEFKGHQGKWTPEHLFVASVNACFMMTFIAIAEYSKLAFVKFSSMARGKLEKMPGAGYQFSEIVIKPTIVIASPQDLARTSRVLEKAKESCFVTNAIKTPVKLEPEVFHHQTQSYPCPLGEAPASGRLPGERNTE